MYLAVLAQAPRPTLKDVVPLKVAHATAGYVARRYLTKLVGRPGLKVTDHAICLDPEPDTVEARTAVFDEIAQSLAEDGVISGWRGEHYAARERFHGPDLFTLERAAVPLFGIEGYGVHMNGYVQKPDGLYMWIGRRSLSKPTSPGKLDQIVAGGQPSGMGLKENLIKECAEEADIPAALAATAQPVGMVSYCYLRSDGLRRDVLFNYDLALPEDFSPRNTDGEIEAFQLLPIEEVAHLIRETDDFKFNCSLVILDFLIRRGFIQPHEPGYVDLVRGLHASTHPDPKPIDL